MEKKANIKLGEKTNKKIAIRIKPRLVNSYTLFEQWKLFKTRPEIFYYALFSSKLK